MFTVIWVTKPMDRFSLTNSTTVNLIPMKLSIRLTVVLVTSAVCLSGCGGQSGSKLKRIHVTGTVKLDGKPLPQGTISFIGNDANAVNAAAEIDASGRYSLSTQQKGDGIPAGSYKVRIESWATPPKMVATGVEPGKSAIPDRYAAIESSGLTATVEGKSKAQVIDFNLTP